jgi:hypothetical protein
MLPKPYSVQSPENIAKEYGGNKMKIAEAAQRGLVDPTAAILAGMFIDRIRSAEAIERAPQQTVAQQVMSPSGISQQTPSPAEAAGVSGLNVPDQMFGGEQSYAAGGLVSFASGGLVPDDEFLKSIMMRESRGRDYRPDGTILTSPKGARGRMQVMPGTQRDPGFGVRPAQNDSPEELARVGEDYALAMRKKYGNDRDAMMAYNWGPGNVDKWIAGGRDPSAVPSETRNYLDASAEAPTGLASLPPEVANAKLDTSELDKPYVPPEMLYGLSGDPKKNAETYKEMFPQDTTRRDQAEAMLEKETDPKERKKQKEQDLWATVAEIGFGMAASKSPYMLQALGESAQAALPKLQERMEKRKDEYKQAVKDLVSIEGVKNADAKAAADWAWDATFKYGSFAAAAEATDMQKRMAKFDAKTKLALTQIGAANDIQIAQIQGQTSRDVAQTNKEAIMSQYQQASIQEKATKMARELLGNPMTALGRKYTALNETAMNESLSQDVRSRAQADIAALEKETMQGLLQEWGVAGAPTSVPAGDAGTSFKTPGGATVSVLD